MGVNGFEQLGKILAQLLVGKGHLPKTNAHTPVLVHAVGPAAEVLSDHGGGIVPNGACSDSK